MRLEKWMFRLLQLAVSVQCLSISHWDLEGANRTCEGSTCNAGNVRTQMGDKLDWQERNCLCDEKCRTYGDCCLDSPYFDFSEQRRGMASFECVDLRQFGGIYMKTTCPPEWAEMETKRMCETAHLNTADPLAGIPATGPSGVTYRNIFCAICHNEEELDVWHARVECPSLRKSEITADVQENISSLLQYSPSNETWGITVNNKFYECDVDPHIPDTSDNIIRRCMPYTVRTCAVNWTNAEVRSRCEAYTSLVFESNNIYRNPHCAICNNVPLQYLLCSRILFRTTFNKDFSPAAFSVLLDWSGATPGKKEACKSGLLYDHFFKRCRSVLGGQDPVPYDHTPKYNRTTLQLPIETFDTNTTSRRFVHCKKFIMEKNEYVIKNDTAFIPVYKKTFQNGEFRIGEDGKMAICVDSIGVKLVDKFGIYMGYVTFAGLGISIIFLLLHLAAFCLVSELRNLPGKNLASLCVSLLIAYTSFMAGQVFLGAPCFVLAIITFYAFLTSFTWMLTMSFDVWRTLRLATAELRVSAGKQWHKFIVYSIWSWIAPAVIVGASIWTELSPSVSADWKPDFAVNSCWFGKSKPLLAFFAAPLGVIMVLNVGFFAFSAIMIYSTTSTTRFTASAGTQRDFRLYVRLAVVMGLTWTTGLVAGILDIEVLWYVFIALNTLQGLFIFLAFTCTDKVIRGLAVRHADDRPLRPPSFSWSSDSTRKSQVGSDQTTDTLY